MADTLADLPRASRRTTAAYHRPLKPAWFKRGVAPSVLICLQISCQMILISGAGSNETLRPLVRTATFALSLALLVLVPRIQRNVAHPATKAALIVVGILLLSLLHPLTNTWTAGFAQVALYLAILSPIFWLVRLPMTMRDLRLLFLTMWLFYSLSSAVGVLQFAFPGKFQPALSSSITGQGDDYVSSLMIKTAEGEDVFRPMGLTDSPGGAAAAGFNAVVLGLGLFLTSRAWWMRAIYLLSMGLGMTCLYLCQVRSSVVEAGLCMLILLGLLIRRGQVAKLGLLLGAVCFVLFGSFLLAFKMGGETVTSRLSTLTEESPQEVYYSNRGLFLDFTIRELLPRFPLGAGLGRWGMMNAYFGNKSDPVRGPIYVEIQWTGWLLDGGVPLILAYSIALAAALHFLWVTTKSKDEQFWVWAAVLLAYDLAACASMFDFPYFASQSGLEFWLLNTALYTTFMTARNANAKRLRIAAHNRLPWIQTPQAVA